MNVSNLRKEEVLFIGFSRVRYMACLVQGGKIRIVFKNVAPFIKIKFKNNPRKNAAPDASGSCFNSPSLDYSD